MSDKIAVGRHPTDRFRGHQLMPKGVARKIPKLYATDGIPSDEKKVYVKFFSNASRHRWYIVEFDGNDTMFGYTEVGGSGEWGYISLKELYGLRNQFRMPAVERDIYGRFPVKFPQAKTASAQKVASRLVFADTRESLSDVTGRWFNEFGKDMRKYDSGMIITKVTYNSIQFKKEIKSDYGNQEDRGGSVKTRQGRLDLNSVGGLDLEIDGRKMSGFSMKDKSGEIIGTIVDRYFKTI